MSDAQVAYIGLGSNVGDSIQALRAAIDALGDLPGTRLLRASRLYRTPAWGRRDQPDFVNAVAALDTRLDARALLDALLALERTFGRDRGGESERWGPRTLDLDLLLYGETTIDQPGLHVPHPHLHERAFVLVPLTEIAPEAVIPGRGTVRAVRDAVADDGIQALP